MMIIVMITSKRLIFSLTLSVSLRRPNNNVLSLFLILQGKKMKFLPWKMEVTEKSMQFMRQDYMI